MTSRSIPIFCANVQTATVVWDNVTFCILQTSAKTLNYDMGKTYLDLALTSSMQYASLAMARSHKVLISNLITTRRIKFLVADNNTLLFQWQCSPRLPLMQFFCLRSLLVSFRSSKTIASHYNHVCLTIFNHLVTPTSSTQFDANTSPHSNYKCHPKVTLMIPCLWRILGK